VLWRKVDIVIMMKGAEALMRSLEKEGVDIVFGLPEEQIFPYTTHW